jgi:hypothetical protein
MTKDSQSFADDMLRRAREELEAVEGQRAEILKAFVAKHGFDPDNTIQVQSNQNGSHTWQVIYTPKEDVVKIRRTLLISRFSREPLSPWKKFCVFLATGKHPK